MYVPRTQISHKHNHHQNHTYRNQATSNFLTKNKNLTQNYESGDTKFWGDQEVVQFKPKQTMESDDSGVCTPPLWKTTNPSPPRSPSQPLISLQSVSPNSRIQAIARGQWELMEMVKNMPESSYELTLKDIVESQVFQSVDQRSPNNSRVRGKYDMNVMRSESFENKGLFLKMVFPFSLKSKKKKNLRNNTSGKVSPKPEGVKGGSEKDWWKKRFMESTDSDNSKTSTNTGSTRSSSDRNYSGNRKKNGFLTSCWPCLQSRSSKSV